jgi:hypothetical protein
LFDLAAEIDNEDVPNQKRPPVVFLRQELNGVNFISAEDTTLHVEVSPKAKYDVATTSHDDMQGFLVKMVRELKGVPIHQLALDSHDKKVVQTFVDTSKADNN